MKPAANSGRRALIVLLILGVLVVIGVELSAGTPEPSGGVRRGPVGAEGASTPTIAPPPPSTTTSSPAPTVPGGMAVPAVAAPRSIASTGQPMTTTTDPPANSNTPGTPAGVSGACGGHPTVVVDGRPWPCTFDDEFNGTSLDSSKWIPQQTATSAYHSGMECFENSPENVSVSGGLLNLTVEQTPAPFVCPSLPPYPTQYTSGMVTTYKRFNQAYGLFEVRAKISGTTQQGLQTSFWLYPAKLTYGPWPDSGEIDIAELFSQYPSLAIPSVHYNNSNNDPTATNHNCVIGDPSQFHTYAVMWTPQSMTFTYDGGTCLVDRWNPAAPQVSPQPFDQPFFICLTQALGIRSNLFLPGVTPLPATTSVDWVRVWGMSASG